MADKPGKLRIILLIVVAAIVAAGWIWFAQQPLKVTVISPERGDSAEIVYADGVVEPRFWSKVTALLRERIVEHCDCEGQTVKAGDVLARLNDREARAALAELEARLRLAKDEVQRLVPLVRSGAAGQQALDRARNEVAQFEAQVRGQRAQLENFIIRAPVSGTVLWEDVEVGEVAEPGTALFWVGQPDPRVIIAEVNEEDIPRVRTGQRALLRSDAFPDRIFEAEVENITPKGDPVAKSYRVRLSLPQDSALMIGMTVDVNIVIRVSENALLVPAIALEGNNLYVVENGKAWRRNVETGIRGIERTEVLSGLAENARIISPYPQDLEDGERVDVRL